MEQRKSNYKKVKTFTLVIFSLLLILLLVIGGIALYDVLGNGYDLAQTKEHLTNLGLGAWSWITSAIGMISTGGVVIFAKFMDYLDNNKDTLLEVKKQGMKLEAIAKTSSDTFNDFKNAVDTKMVKYDEKQITTTEIIELILDTIYDEALREKILERLEKLKETNEEGA